VLGEIADQHGMRVIEGPAELPWTPDTQGVSRRAWSAA
jgi:hypothetical protein